MNQTTLPLPEALTLLRCDACGGAVPLSDAEHERCPYCQHEVRLPEDYRAAVRAQQGDGPARARAAALYAELSARPGLFLRACALLFSGWGWVVALLTGMVMVLMGGMLLIVGYAGVPFHVHVYDTVSEGAKNLFVLGGMTGVILVGTTLGVYGRRRALSTAALQAALSARAPTRPGGPAECRVCGGPLRVPEDALGVRCLYCRTDNLVAASTGWLRQRVEATAGVARQVEQAAADLAAERRELRRAVRWRVGVTAAVIGGLLGLLALAVRRPDYPRSTAALGTSYSYRDHMGEPRTLLRRGHLARMKGWGPEESVPLASSPCATELPFSLGREQCDAGGCVVWLFAAVRRGETVTLRSATFPEGTTLRSYRHEIPWAIWPKKQDEPFGPLEAEVALGPAHPATLRPAWSSWYEWQIRLPAEAAGKAQTLCASVEQTR